MMERERVPNASPRRRGVRVQDGTGAPLADLDVARVAANGTVLSGRTDAEGIVWFSDAYRGFVTLLVAGNGFQGRVMTSDGAWSDLLAINTEELPHGGSVIFGHGTGDVPDISGRLNPIRDNLGRMYAYGDNLSFDDSPAQPFSFDVDEDFEVEDAHGARARLTVRVVLGQTSLLDYQLLRRSVAASA